MITIVTQAQNSEQSYADLPLIELSTETTFTPTFNSTGMMTGGGSSTSYYFRTPNHDEFKSIGSSANNLGKYIEKVPPAYEHLETYRSKKSGGLLLAIGGGVVAVIGATAGTEKTGETAFNYQTGQVEEKVKITSGGVAGLVIGGIGLLVGGVTMNSASEYIEKAVITYNNEIKSDRTFKETEKSIDSQSTASNFQLRISPSIDFSKAGVSFKLAF
ncbi:MAG: hypothetical protein ACQETE_07635 [Bacteroidota bacterium]